MRRSYQKYKHCVYWPILRQIVLNNNILVWSTTVVAIFEICGVDKIVDLIAFVEVSIKIINSLWAKEKEYSYWS